MDDTLLLHNWAQVDFESSGIFMNSFHYFLGFRWRDMRQQSSTESEHGPLRVVENATEISLGC